jgi:hypothetical protein
MRYGVKQRVEHSIGDGWPIENVKTSRPTWNPNSTFSSQADHISVRPDKIVFISLSQYAQCEGVQHSRHCECHPGHLLARILFLTRYRCLCV